VILYRWDRQPEDGLVNPASFLQEHALEWMSAQGRIEICPLESCKAVCFVSEGAKADLFTEHSTFERRPRVPGLWTRFRFRDGAVLDGILSHNLLEWPAAGYFVTPPQARATRQRVFIPRAALIATELRGVVGGSVRAAAITPQELTPEARQLSMFDS
jgi:hypothetical protein